jgi:uracil-DNA glycosylase
MSKENQMGLFGPPLSDSETDPPRPLSTVDNQAIKLDFCAEQAEPLYTKEESETELQKIAGQIGVCTKCHLHNTRTNTVPGEGMAHPDIMFIGEAPGADEDLQGRPFVGRAGQLLTKMIEAMGYNRNEVFIGNILKCRPPGNRTPNGDEMAICIPFLEKQIELVRPRVIVTLGKTALQGLLNRSVAITRIRGTWQKYKGFDLMPTYHPSYLLRPPLVQQRERKKETWDDLKEVLKFLGREIPHLKEK